MNIRDYDLLIGQLHGLTIQTIEDGIDTMGVVNIRHDIDNDLSKAVKFARQEFTDDIKTTYFILNTAPYWEDKQGLKDAIFFLQELGHRIGWHNNAIADNMVTGKTLENCITSPLETLRKYANVVGTASHGDPLCHTHGFINYYIWKGIPEHPGFPKYYWQKQNLEDYGMKYEAYFTGHTHYITESGGHWHQDNKTVIEDFKLKLNEGEKVKLQILIHPQWWTL